jgi:site-specific DNA recombinase
MPEKKLVWLYYRLSRDEDKELNSLSNQKQILVDYAKNHNYEIIGESFDDNVSGMHFDRKGIEELQDAVDKHIINTVLVKDLSRLGRHKTQTALFIDYLRQNNVNVFSVTENINTLDENDDLIIGFKGLINDSYAKDISKKIRNGYKQKQKQGIVIIPPFGYYKDKLTKEITINDECANIVRLIFDLYINGNGYKKIANYLNEHGYKSPSYYQKQFYNKNNPNTKTTLADKYLWQDRTVSEIIHNEAYIGTLICGKNYKSTIYHIRKRTDEKEQFRHENYYEPILTNEIWKTAQTILKNRSNTPVRASKNHKIHKYAGLLQCKECNATFVAKWVNGEVIYVCNTYHRRGAKYCTSHRIKESELDGLVLRYLDKLLQVSKNNLDYINLQLKSLLLTNYDSNREIIKIQSQIEELETENKNAIKQSLKYPDREDMLTEIISDNRHQIKLFQEQIDRIKNQKITCNNAKKQLNDIISIIEDMINTKNISSVNIQQIISKIYISQSEDKILNFDILLHSQFEYQFNFYTEVKASCADFYSVINKLSTL